MCVPLCGCQTHKPFAAWPPLPFSARATVGNLQQLPSKLPGKYALRRGTYVFYTDHPWPDDPALLDELEHLADEVYGNLHLPDGQTVIQVFLFDTQEEYEQYLKARYPHLPPRRAYFLQEPQLSGQDELKVLTWCGDHLRTDLRHELTHALLHAVLKDVPLWLDEGLASCFELPPLQRGINPSHLEQLKRGPFQPDLARLETLQSVEKMEKAEYREAWAWVHFLLYGDPADRQLLQEYLQELRHHSRPTPLLPRLQRRYADPAAQLLRHLASLEWPPISSSPHP